MAVLPMRSWLLISSVVVAPLGFAYWICWLLAKAEEHAPSPTKEKDTSDA